ncbi:metal-binding protein ZinT [Macrococcoides caseolyticum]|uniref:metal-binding protein ZinT n=1 Tax=Macrococcoides caseolyticum TaxID=69966 RepID=UPI001F27ECE7|nr:metal-binding protein ZinT [Macrococcus caseolyticus]MCE4957166.1 metal-binding protein ZinT [Macrococcus caseolyticus]
MNKNILSCISVLSLSLLITGCQNDNDKKEITNESSSQHEHHEKEHQHAHHHGHEMTPEQQKIYKGFFKDAQVKDRPLTDWEGDWQSVYPYLKDGTLDEVFQHKAELDKNKTANEFKDYYTTGYKTDVTRIKIGEKEISFYKNDKKATAEYMYDGKEILKYEAGNRGVRYIFKKVSGDDIAPKYIQFSDHIIAPEKALHFHIYMGDDKAQLLKEMDNWPTYYPSDLKGSEIKEEMLAH